MVTAYINTFDRVMRVYDLFIQRSDCRDQQKVGICFIIQRDAAMRRRHTAKRLASYGILTMRDIAQADEDFLYHLFGIDAELLIDHAWGREPVTIADIKSYKPGFNCLSSGQVLPFDYPFEDGGQI